MRTWRWLLVGILAVIGVLGGARCGGTGRLDAPTAGRTQVYVSGVPNFDLVAMARLRDGRTGIDCYLGLPHASLVFLPAGATYEARFDVLYRLYDERGRELLAEYTDADTVRLATYDATQRFEPYITEKRLDVEPGTYVLDVVVTDAESKEEARRRQRVEVLTPGEKQPAVSRMLMEGRRPGRAFEPILSLHVPAGLDSLRTTVALQNAAYLESLQVTMRLLQFPSDTVAARPPYYHQVSPFYGLVRYDQPDTLQVTRRLLRDVDPEVVMTFDLPVLDEGIYRIEVAATPPGHDGEVALLTRQRDFAVRSAAFPKITTLDEMIEALTYIATDDELEHIASASTAKEKKRRFDAFWGGLITNRQAAANLIKLYYSRVEEANLRYSTFKEGWKTDRGMVYILFGPPLYVDWSPEGETWHYSYDDRSALQAFVFERRPLYRSNGVFEAYALQRGWHLEREWRRARERWREGEML